MKLIRAEPQTEIEGSFEDLAETLAMWHAEDVNLYEELFSRVSQGDWLPEIPPEMCLHIVQGTGLQLMNDDGTPASHDTVVSLGERAWEKILQIVELEVEDEF
ncbi:hypothetical protein ACFLW8_02600 [Chloroflexota bacterium]